MTERSRDKERVIGGISPRAAAWLAWSLAGLSVAMFLASRVLYVLAQVAQETLGIGGALGELLFNGPFLAFSLVGALIAARRPRNRVGWICLAVGCLWMLGGLSNGYVTYGIAKPGSLPFVAMFAALIDSMWWTTVGLLGIYLLLLFPDGRLPSGRWRPLAWLSGAAIVLLGVVSVLDPGPLAGLEGVRNPLGLEGASWLVDAVMVLMVVLILLVVACILASAVSLVMRYRRSGEEVREQIKWIALAGSLVSLLAIVGILGVLSVPEDMGGSGDVLPLWLRALLYVMNLSFASIPVAIGFAVLKYRLYDIDLLINRALVYGSLTLTLVALYFGGIVLLQGVFIALTGQQSTLAVVASTLAIAALFNPLRHRVQAFVDRRFYRRKYDARKILEAFSTTLRDETDLEALNDELVSVVRQTMQPAYVSLWLRPDTPPEGEQAH